MVDKISIELTIEQQKALNSLNKLNSAFKTTQNSINKISAGFSSFVGNLAATGVTRAIDGIKDAIIGTVDAAAQLEVFETQFETILGSTEAAQKQLEELQQFAATTPFQLPGIANSARQLLAFGFESEKVIPLLNRLGDVAAGSGSDLREITTIFGQVSAAGKLTGERLLQFQERAIPIGPAIAKTMGVAESAVRDLVSRGKVDFATFEKAFSSLSEEGGMFAGSINKQSKTLTGVISTLKDNVFLLQGAFGKAFAPIIAENAQKLTTILQDLAKQAPAFAKLTKTVGEFVGFLSSGSLGEQLADNEDVELIGELNSKIADTSKEIESVKEKIQGFEKGSIWNFLRDPGDLKNELSELENRLVLLKNQRDVMMQQPVAVVSEEEMAKYWIPVDAIQKNAEKTTSILTENANKRVELELATQEKIKEIKDNVALAEQEALLLGRENKIAQEELDLEHLRTVLDRETMAKLEAREMQLKMEKDADKRAILQEKLAADKKMEILKAEKKSRENGLESLTKFEVKNSKTRINNLQSSLSTISTLQSSSNKTLFMVGKAAALANATVSGIVAVQNALASVPYPANFVVAGLVGVATAANIAKIAAQKPPSFETGGIVPGKPSARDNTIANVASGEAVLTMEDQKSLLESIRSGILQAAQPIIVEIDGMAVATAVRNARLNGATI